MNKEETLGNCNIEYQQQIEGFVGYYIDGKKTNSAISKFTYELEKAETKNKTLQSQLDIANKKLEQVKDQVHTQQSIIKRQPGENKEIDNYILARLDTILSIIGGE